MLYEKKYSITGAIGVLKKKNNCEIEKKNIIQELKHLIDEIEKNIYTISGRGAAWFSVSVWGTGGRWFKSSRPDQLKNL